MPYRFAPATVPAFLAAYALPAGRWVPAHFDKRFGFAFKTFRHRRGALCAHVPLARAVAVGATVGMSARGVLSCQAQLVVMAVLPLAAAVVAVVAAPFRIPMQGATEALSNAATAFAVFAVSGAVPALQADAAPAAVHAAVTCTAVASVALTGAKLLERFRYGKVEKRGLRAEAASAATATAGAADQEMTPIVASPAVVAKPPAGTSKMSTTPPRRPTNPLRRDSPGRSVSQ